MAFVRESDIYTVRPDGTGLRRLTHGRRSEEPAWSPDGRWLAYGHVRTDGNMSLWVMRADGGDKRQLVKLIGWYGVDWSPDGTRIAFHASADDLDAIFVLDLHSGAVVRVSKVERGWTGPSRPRWSPDGRRIAFVAVAKHGIHDSYTYPVSVFTMAGDGGDVHRVRGTQSVLGFDWGSTGEIVYSSGLDTRGGVCNGDLYVTGPSGADHRRVVAMPCRETAPAWSPDGRRIVFTSDGPQPRDENRPDVGIWVADADGGNAHLVVRGAGYDPAWQPTG